VTSFVTAAATAVPSALNALPTVLAVAALCVAVAVEIIAIPGMLLPGATVTLIAGALIGAGRPPLAVAIPMVIAVIGADQLAYFSGAFLIDWWRRRHPAGPARPGRQSPDHLGEPHLEDRQLGESLLEDRHLGESLHEDRQLGEPLLEDRQLGERQPGELQLGDRQLGELRLSDREGQEQDRASEPAGQRGRAATWLTAAMPTVAGAVRMPYRSFAARMLILRVPWLALTLSVGTLAAEWLARIGHVAGLGGVIVSAIVVVCLLIARHRPGAVRVLSRGTAAFRRR
jgi:membrane protein DedA with SNARE-associated domain